SEFLALCCLAVLASPEFYLPNRRFYYVKFQIGRFPFVDYTLLIRAWKRAVVQEVMEEGNGADSVFGLGARPSKKSHEFWDQQPVPKLSKTSQDDFPSVSSGPITTFQVDSQPLPLPEAFEWCYWKKG